VCVRSRPPEGRRGGWRRGGEGRRDAAGAGKAGPPPPPRFLARAQWSLLASRGGLGPRTHSRSATIIYYAPRCNRVSRTHPDSPRLMALAGAACVQDGCRVRCQWVCGTLSALLSGRPGANSGPKRPDSPGLTGFLSKRFDRKPVSPPLLFIGIPHFTRFRIVWTVSPRVAIIRKHEGIRVSTSGQRAIGRVPGHLF
jgi:hypothetical protein